MTEEATTVGVLGAGTMGVGIAVVMLRAGHRVILRDVNEALAAQGGQQVGAFLERSVAIGKMSADDRQEALGRLACTSSFGRLEPCDVVIEAIVEDVVLKREVFGQLDDVCKPEALFHSNTSTLSVTEIAAGSSRPDRVVGTHYCNPAPLMRLVEVVKARQTSEDSYQRTVAFVRGLGKKAVTTKDVPGFIVNRFLIPFENDCIRALERGDGSVEDIDRVVASGFGYPMGPFTLLDIVGLDVHRLVAMSLYDQLRDPRFAPPPLVDRMIAAGTLGRKTRRGFYDYPDAALFGAR